MPTPLEVMGVRVHPVDLEQATDIVISAAIERRKLTVSALAVHGLVLASRDAKLRFRLNHLDLVVPDGQPVRWAMNMLHGAGLRERVMGPELMSRLCQEAQRKSMPVFLLGTTLPDLELLETKLSAAFPGLEVAGTRPSRFRPATPREAQEDIQLIRTSGARMTFVGFGCPRQEIWAYENGAELNMPVLAVGAAFDYHSGKLRRAPAWAAASGLEWVFRLRQEPKRLWRRYLETNPRFVVGLIRQAMGFGFDPQGTQPTNRLFPG